MKKLKYKIWNKKTKRFVQEDTDIDNRKGCDLGEYALSPNGELLFFECTDGGMNVREVKDCDIIQYNI